MLVEKEVQSIPTIIDEHVDPEVNELFRLHDIAHLSGTETERIAHIEQRYQGVHPPQEEATITADLITEDVIINLRSTPFRSSRQMRRYRGIRTRQKRFGMEGTYDEERLRRLGILEQGQIDAAEPNLEIDIADLLGPTPPPRIPESAEVRDHALASLFVEPDKAGHDLPNTAQTEEVNLGLFDSATGGEMIVPQMKKRGRWSRIKNVARTAVQATKEKVAAVPRKKVAAAAIGLAAFTGIGMTATPSSETTSTTELTTNSGPVLETASPATSVEATPISMLSPAEAEAFEAYLDCHTQYDETCHDVIEYAALVD